MTIATIDAQDAVNADAIPSNVLAAGYDTGSVAWTTTQFAAHSNPYPAIHIDQDPGAEDPLSDILDVEARAATVFEIVGWIGRARANYLRVARPGQRWPGIYLSTGNLNAAVQSLQGAGIVNVPFWLAEPGTSYTDAVWQVATATGPYPCIGVQYVFGNRTDLDVFSLPWVQNVSKVPAPPIQTLSVTVYSTELGIGGYGEPPADIYVYGPGNVIVGAKIRWDQPSVHISGLKPSTRYYVKVLDSTGRWLTKIVTTRA